MNLTSAIVQRPILRDDQTAITLPGPVTVPSDFLGMCWMRYPYIGTDYNPDGIIRWGSCRVSQIYEMHWNRIETPSAGVYDATALSALDQIVTFQRQNGVSVMMGLYGTPVFYAQSSPTGASTYADNVTYGVWGLLGAGSYPTSLAAVTAFVNMLVTRYNLPGGTWYDANGATLGKGIQLWEEWNEPAIWPTGTQTNGNSTGSGGTGQGFAWMDKEQLVDLCYTQYAAIKALDPSIIVLSPGLDSGDSVTRAGRFFPAVGTVTGKTGAQSCDAFAWHPYSRLGHNYPTYGAWTDGDIVQNADAGITAIRAMLTSYGVPNMPIYISEWGMDELQTSPTGALWYAESALYRRAFMECFLLTCAAFGVKQVHPWHWQQPSTTNGNSGAWPVDTNGVTAAYNAIADNVVGKTIVGLKATAYNRMTATFSDGTTYTTAG